MAEGVGESDEVRETEAAATTAAGAGFGAALALAAARRGVKSDGDPGLDALLAEQTRLARLQSEDLRDQRELVMSRLRWGRFSDRMKALLQLMTALVGAGLVVMVAIMIWQARSQHGLVIEAFSVPPDVGRSGLTGQVAASRFLDKLQALQTATEDSDRPAQSYESNWGSDVRVEIPETGLTFSDFEKLLRDKVGHVTHVTGEILTTPDGIAVTARMGDAPPQTFTGPAGAFDDLARQAAEAVYRANQPYRFTEYLDKQGRWDEAFAVVSQLAANGPASERGWAYARWALMDLNDHGDIASARIHAARGLGFGAGSDLEDRIALVNTEVWSGHDEAVLAISKILDRDDQRRLPDTSELFYVENKLLGRAWLQFVTPDFLASAHTWIAIVRRETDAHFATLAPAMAETADALGHDLGAAAAVQRSTPSPADAALIWNIAQGAFLAAPTYWVAAERGDWATALADARAADAALEADGARRPIYGPMQRVWIWPLEAQALAGGGQMADAETLIGKTPLDCYLCLRVRGRIAAEARDWAAADRWFAEAVRQAPSLPFAYAEWARTRLARGAPDGAIALAKLARAKALRFADPPEIWGDALMAKGDFAGAAGRFAEADKLAPRWGTNHLHWGEALAKLGRRAEARSQLRAASKLDLTASDRGELTRSAT